MTTFDKREEGFEKQFAHDEELKFKAMARRNKLLGLWAAEKLGMTGADADAYAKEVVMAEFEAGGDDGRAEQGAQGFRGQRCRAIGRTDWSDDEAISGAGGGADQGGLIAAAMRSSTCATSAAISFARTSIT